MFRISIAFGRGNGMLSHAFPMSVQSLLCTKWLESVLTAFATSDGNLISNLTISIFISANLSNSTFNSEVNILVSPHILVVLFRLLFQCLYFIWELRLT